ncbi:unnamed protein product [Phytomonas sp. Hart1]|nr:unnamed protein product [Phytomonas sp. Hart1]|eukprot:CCW69628.1 unnamed protein product [Phytomonas sp. isolate Hart1]
MFVVLAFVLCNFAMTISGKNGVIMIKDKHFSTLQDTYNDDNNDFADWADTFILLGVSIVFSGVICVVVLLIRYKQKLHRHNTGSFLSTIDGSDLTTEDTSSYTGTELSVDFTQQWEEDSTFVPIPLSPETTGNFKNLNHEAVDQTAPQEEKYPHTNRSEWSKNQNNPTVEQQRLAMQNVSTRYPMKNQTSFM